MEEKHSIQALISQPALKLELKLDARATREDVMQAVDEVCRSLVQLDATREVVSVSLGRLLALVQDRKLYQPEFKSFERFRLATAERYGLARSTISECLAIARALPQITDEQVRHIPKTNLALVARAAKEVPRRKIPALLRQAEHRSVAGFRESLDEQGLLKRGPGRETKPGIVVLTIRVSVGVARAWRAYVGEGDPGEVFAGLIKLIKPAKRSKAA